MDGRCHRRTKPSCSHTHTHTIVIHNDKRTLFRTQHFAEQLTNDNNEIMCTIWIAAGWLVVALRFAYNNHDFMHLWAIFLNMDSSSCFFSAALDFTRCVNGHRVDSFDKSFIHLQRSGKRLLILFAGLAQSIRNEEKKNSVCGKTSGLDGVWRSIEMWYKTNSRSKALKIIK